jgi:4-nitrophenyl phosphatase
LVLRGAGHAALGIARLALGVHAANLRHDTYSYRVQQGSTSFMTDRLPTQPRLVIFDLDGVVYRGREPVPGSAGLVAELHAAGRLVRFATNNSTATRDEYVARLAAMGIPTARDEVVTSTSATVEHLSRHLPEVRSVLALGESGLARELRDAGYQVTTAEEASAEGYEGQDLEDTFDAVVCGLDREVTFRRIATAATAVRCGARFIATNADLRFPTPVGFLPGAGSIVAAVSSASGQAPLVIGKPEPAMFQAILESVEIPASQAVVIGDNPDSDVVAARRAGIACILVLTGIADASLAAVLDGDRRPDVVVAGTEELRGRLAPRLS